MTDRRETAALMKASMSRYLRLTDDEFDIFFQRFYYRQLARKATWFRPGDPCQEIVFVIKGCLRYFYIHQEEERTGQFFFEGAWFTDYESWLLRQPSAIGCDALEDTELMVIAFSDLEKLYDSYPHFERIGRLMAENTIMGISRRNRSLLSDSPEEAYLRLMKERPKVLARVPQHLIASYLGIEPESLSRIRKKIASRDKA